MRVPFPTGWTFASTTTWTFTVVIAAKIALWAVDRVGPMLAGALRGVG